MQLTEGQIATIAYTSDRTGLSSSRTIVPFTVPADFVKAIDIDDQLPNEREHIAQLVTEYAEYRAQQLAKMFNFEDWLEHSKSIAFVPKWRTFKLSGLE